jgi:hypothetical protein
MASFQLMIRAIEIMFLLAIFCPSCTLAIYWLFPQQRHVSQKRKFIGMCLLIIAICLFLLMIGFIANTQYIRPVCVGRGDPQYMWCVGNNNTPHEEARRIMAAKVVQELLTYVVLPSILGVGFLTWFLQHTNNSKQPATE